MNSITGSKIFWCIDIDTGSTENLPNMFLESGHIRFSTNNYSPPTSATYEGGAPVTGTWYKDSLKMDGLDESGITIDLSTGTGYSTLNGWSFSIINRDATGAPYHKTLLNTSTTYIIGSTVTLYAAIDDILYPRWSGIISDYAITENSLKINCDDRFIKEYGLFPKTTIGDTNYPNALTDDKGGVVPVCFGNVKYAKPINVEELTTRFKVGTSFPLVRFKPSISTGSDSSYDSLNDDDIDFDSGLENQYLGFSNFKSNVGGGANLLYSIINDNQFCVGITIPNTYDYSDFIGKYITLSTNSNATSATINDAEFIKIADAKVATSPILSSKSTKLLYLYIDGVPDGIFDYNNFYGNITVEPIPGINEMTYESYYVYVWEVSNKFKISENQITVVNSYIDSDVVLTEHGDITCYKVYDGNNIMSFNPLTIEYLGNNEYSIMKGTSEIYHIPNSARWLKYAANYDPINIESLGNSQCSKVLDPTIVFDDDNLCVKTWKGSLQYIRDLAQLSSTLPTYNTKSQITYEVDIDEKGTINTPVLSYIMNYNIDTFNPKKYSRVVPAPVWNVHATMLGYWDSVWNTYHPTDNHAVTTQKATVYGLTDSTFNGLVLTAEMGSIQSPVQRTRMFWKFDEVGPNMITALGLPTIYSKCVTIPSPKDANDMTGALYNNYANPGEVQNAVYGHSYFGGVNSNKEGLIGYYKCYNGNKESLVLDSSTTNTITPISSNLWNGFDSDGNITLVMELTGNSGDDVQWCSKTVHLIGLNAYIDYEPKDLYLRVIGETANSFVPDAFDTLLNFYNKISYVGKSEILSRRGDWNIGRQVLEQKNSLDYIDELCQQSWVIGWTNRSGNVQLKCIEDESTIHIHDDNLIIRNSIKNFGLTPLTKVYNELTVKADYNEITKNYDKIYSVDNIEEDSFPLDSDGSTQDPLVTVPYNVSSIKFDEDGGDCVYSQFYQYLTTPLVLGDTIVIYPKKIRTYTGLIVNDTWDYDPYIPTGSTSLTVDDISGTVLTFSRSGVSGELANKMLQHPGETIDILFDIENVYVSRVNNTLPVWKSWVQGIDSYLDAKDIWNTSKNAWYTNKTVNKMPDSASNLSWFGNLNNFYDVTNYDETNESGYKFFKKALEWVTAQKYMIEYEIPLTADTVKIELADTVDLFDPILTGYVDGDPSYLRGIVTSLNVKPKENRIAVKLTAKMQFITPAPFPVIGDIIERGAIIGVNDDNIIERGAIVGAGDNDILEG